MKRVALTRARWLVAGLLLIGLAALAAGRRGSKAGNHPDPHGHRRARHGDARRAPRRAGTERHHAIPPASPWASREACLAALTHGRAPRAAGKARIGAWNLHWFPDGRPGDTPSGGADIEWLACAIAWMNVDVLALEEVKRPPRGDEGLAELRRALERLTGSTFRTVLDTCPLASGQHVGLLYDEQRVKVGPTLTIGALNPRGDACKDELRPGLSGYFRFPGGLDLSVIAAHLKSGSDPRAIEERARSFGAFAEAARVASAAARDADVLLLGDMNSMGCATCAPEVSPSAELTRADAIFAALAPPVARLPASPACSHHFKSRSTLLDWAAKSDLSELPAGTSVTVSGACGELGCEALSAGLAAQAALSDHCPIWLDLDDIDRD
jgi:endonuclease/exonuclease/phosphatase family metal-dependent hydrolase